MLLVTSRPPPHIIKRRNHSKSWYPRCLCISKVTFSQACVIHRNVLDYCFPPKDGHLSIMTQISNQFRQLVLRKRPKRPRKMAGTRSKRRRKEKQSNNHERGTLHEWICGRMVADWIGREKNTLLPDKFIRHNPQHDNNNNDDSAFSAVGILSSFRVQKPATHTDKSRRGKKKRKK